MPYIQNISRVSLTIDLARDIAGFGRTLYLPAGKILLNVPTEMITEKNICAYAEKRMIRIVDNPSVNTTQPSSKTVPNKTFSTEKNDAASQSTAATPASTKESRKYLFKDK